MLLKVHITVMTSLPIGTKPYYMPYKEIYNLLSNSKMHSTDNDTALSMATRITSLKTTRLNLQICLWQKSTMRFLRVFMSGRRLIVL
jgi:hypothetical protein